MVASQPTWRHPQVESCKSKKVPRIATAAGKYRHLDTDGWNAPLAWLEFADWSDVRIIERGRILG
jgi:hypothetical protein